MKQYITAVFRGPSSVDVLRELFRAEGPLAAPEIAERSGVSRAQVFRELRDLVAAGVVQRMARTLPQPTYALNPDQPAFCDALAALFRVEGLDPSDRAAAARRVMQDWGAPLSRDAADDGNLPPIEEALAVAVRLARQDPTLLTTLPRVIEETVKRGCWKSPAFGTRLLAWAETESVVRHLGALLDITAKLMGSAALARCAARFRRRLTVPRKPRPFSGFFRSAHEEALARAQTPPLLRDQWRMLINMDEQAFAHHLGRTARENMRSMQ